LVEVSATVDDLDPRVWPAVVEELLLGGALDAWTTPVLMKKGRHGTVVTALAEPEEREAVVELLLHHTTTLGVRWHEVRRTALDRVWREVTVLGQPVRVKIGSRDGHVVTVTPELEDCRELALRREEPLRVVLRAAEAAAQASGWEAGAAI
jgi:pyridinium-3,5-bisthiocarboxylic acid mononucleotide nickel chelatase